MGKSRNTTAIIAALSTAWPSIATPQTARTGGLEVDVGVGTSVTVDDNLELDPVSPGTSYISDTTLSFGISSITGSQALNVIGSGVLRFADIPGRSIAGFEDPKIVGSYVITSKNSRFTIDGRYEYVDREFLDPFQVALEDQQAAGGLNGDGGTLELWNAGILYETGLNAPMKLAFSARNFGRNYYDVPVFNTDLFDATTNALGLTIGYDISPVTLVFANVSQSWYEAEDIPQTDRDTLSYSVGLSQDINQALTLGASIGFTQIDETQFGLPNDQDSNIGSVSLVQQLRNGDVSILLDRSADINGSRTSLTFGRSLTLPRGDLGLTVGLSRGPGGSVDWIGSLDYNRQLKSSSFFVAFIQRATTDNNDNEILDTRLNAGYTYDITSISRVNLTMGLGHSESSGTGNAPTIDRVNFVAAYSHDLTKDWTIDGGYQFRYLDDSSNTGSATSNSIFVALGRNFSFRP